MPASLDTFAKVRALHDSATLPGEKAAAAARMQVLARKAGLTVAEAVSKLDAGKAKQAPQPKTPAQAAAAAFNEFFGSPEMRAAAAKREAERQVRAAAVIAEHGSEEAVFADTPREAALRAACAHLMVWDPRPEWSGHYHLAGWDSLGSRTTMPAAVREAVSRGWPLPGSVAEAWTEREAAEKLEQDRQTCTGGEYIPHSWVEARRYVLEDLLDTLPARSLTDLRARLSWMERLNEAGYSHPYEDDRVRLATLRADIERMGARIRDQDGSPIPPVEVSRSPDPAPALVQTGHRPTTRAERRAAAAALIAEGLSDREAARRLGISPTTVGLVRRDIGKARP